LLVALEEVVDGVAVLRLDELQHALAVARRLLDDGPFGELAGRSGIARQSRLDRDGRGEALRQPGRLERRLEVLDDRDAAAESDRGRERQRCEEPARDRTHDHASSSFQSSLPCSLRRPTLRAAPAAATNGPARRPAPVVAVARAEALIVRQWYELPPHRAGPRRSGAPEVL